MPKLVVLSLSLVSEAIETDGTSVSPLGYSVLVLEVSFGWLLRIAKRRSDVNKKELGCHKLQFVHNNVVNCQLEIKLARPDSSFAS